MKTLTVATLKGGEGKTFTSALICRELARNNRVLAVSICSQNNLNIYLGGSVGDNQLYHAIEKNDIRLAITNTRFKNIDIVPYNINDTPSVDRLMQSMAGSENRLKLLLNQVCDDYDYAILDTGPNLNISTISAIVASNYLISPMQMEWSSIDGFVATTNAVNEMNELGLSQCKQLGVLISKSNICRNRETFEVEEEVQKDVYSQLGMLPYMSSLRHALYEFKDYDDVKPKHNLERVKESINNVISQLS